MALNIPSQTSQEFLYELNRNEIIGLIIFTLEKLEWYGVGIKEDGILAEAEDTETSEWYAIELVAEPQKLFVKSMSEKGKAHNWERNKRNIEIFVTAFNELRDSLTKEELLSKYTEFKEVLDSPDEVEKTSFKEKLKEFVSFIIPTEFSFIAPILFWINVAVFILMVLSGVDFMRPNSQNIIDWGGNNLPLILTGEWWRLLTSVFVHGGFEHLAFNMLALFYVGAMLEGLIGRILFAFSYLLSGLIASIVSVNFHSVGVSAGASGAIFGSFGVLLALLLTNYGDKELRVRFLFGVLFFIGINLLAGMKQGIDNAGHIGGLAGGILIGLMIYPLVIKPRTPKFTFSVLGLILVGVVCISGFVFTSIYNNVVQYDKQIKMFEIKEVKPSR